MFLGWLAYLRTLLVSKAELERSKDLVKNYKLGRIPEMNEELWRAKKSIFKLRNRVDC